MKINRSKIKKFQTKPAKGDILPLMDCMFILLIYFVFSMIDMTEHPGVRVDTPASLTSQKLAKSFNSLGVNKEGKYFLNKKQIELDRLQEELELAVINDTTKEGKKIFVTADREAKAQAVLKMMEKLRQIRQNSVYIETKERSQK